MRCCSMVLMLSLWYRGVMLKQHWHSINREIITMALAPYSVSMRSGDAAIPIRPHATNGADHDGPTPLFHPHWTAIFPHMMTRHPIQTTHNARRTYSAEFMRDINRSNICPLKRQTQKRLFKYRLWYDNVKHSGFSVNVNSRWLTLNQSQCVLTRTTTLTIRINLSA